MGVLHAAQSRFTGVYLSKPSTSAFSATVNLLLKPGYKGQIGGPDLGCLDESCRRSLRSGPILGRLSRAESIAGSCFRSFSQGTCRRSASTRCAISRTHSVAMSTTAGTASPATPSTATMDADTSAQGGSVLRLLESVCGESLRANFPNEEGLEPMVAACAQPKFGDYQFNNAMSIFAKVKKEGTFKNPRAVAEALLSSLPPSPMIKSTSIAGAGFVNLVIDTAWVEKRIEKMLVEGVQSWAPKLPVKKALVDFSSPNIAKEMHVGHLRSTIIGESIARMLEFCNVEVLRRNHVGDWGTQFGMLIQNLFETFPNWEDIGEQAIGDLQTFYKGAKKRFDEDEEFKERARQAVVKLQGGDPVYRAAWIKICDVSRKEFEELYKRLNVHLEEKGESFYNPYIPDVLNELQTKGLARLEEEQGALCIFLDGFTIPFIIRKSDGGYNYASTDLACLWYRLNEERAEWIVYVTDVGQGQHFAMLFKSANLAGWIPENWEKVGSVPRVSHVGFGLVMGSDGKRFRTRSSDVVRLADLLDEAKERVHKGLAERVASLQGTDGVEEWSEEELTAAAEALGYGAVKYADLKQNRATNYTFSFDQMLDLRGNTAVYLIYAHTRICSIIRKSGKDIEALKKAGGLKLEHPAERSLGMLLIRFPEILEEAVNNLLPNTVCDYLYQLSVQLSELYDKCKVVGSPEEDSRLLLIEATAVMMRQCFELLGITPLYRLPKAMAVPRKEGEATAAAEEEAE